MTASLDLEAAWQRECFTRERREYRLLMAAGAAVFAMYGAVDVLLEPARAPGFLPLRGLGVAVWLLGLTAVGRATTLARAQAGLIVTVLATGSLVVAMMLRVDHFEVYLVGYSAYFWASGLASWSLATALAIATAQLALVAIVLAADRQGGAAHAIGALSYLGTAAAVATLASRGRRAAFRATFEASHVLAQRNAELEIALSRLGEAQARLVAHEKLSALGRMLAGLSHELNNPLNVIQNNLEPVREHLASMIAVLEAARAPAGGAATVEPAWQAHELDWRIPDLRDALDGMATATGHMRQVHQDLRAFIRGDTPGIVATDVAEGLRVTVALATRRGPAEVQVQVELEPLPPIACQPGQLNQVWLNLIQNALDAIGPRGTLSVRARRAGDHLEIVVADDGPGVPPDFRLRLFEPFATTKAPGKGTGLGLAVSHEIIERHGGRLYLDDTQVTGARFVVELPVGRA